ncbi:MAG TPA: energy transducer TonB [Candidatus Dormibacteraeota bacterium]|nr:energy transducer TonB [Candidatus Dormibacteraeota bacterium]
MSLRALRITIFILFASVVSFSQDAPTVAPLPYDPLELATGPTVVPDTPAKREVLLNLLERARQNSAMHSPGMSPFSIKVSFNSIGKDSHNQGYGEVEETWLNGQTWRWSARLGDYSQLRIFYQGQVYDDKPHGHMPLRLQTVRNSVFWPVVGNFSSSLLRMATAKWEDTELACILISGAVNDATATPGRRWEENEYCIDPKTGLLRIHSEAPGIYSVYDYNGGIQFHGRVLPRQTTIVEGGTGVLQIHLDSLEGANNDPNQFIPTKKMLAHGPGAVMVGPFRFPESVRAPAGFIGTIQPVIVHAILDQKGKVLDAEVVQSSDPALATAALDVVWHSSYLPARRQDRPLQREAFINVKFTPAS